MRKVLALKKKRFLHSMCAILGLWVVHVILGFNQNWLEMPLMLCHTAAQGFMAGGQWEEHHLLSGINTPCPRLPSVSTSCCCPNSCHLSWSLWGSPCEMEAVFAWVHIWWIIWTGGILVVEISCFWSPGPLLMGKGRDCVTSVLLTVLGVTAPAPAQIQCDEPRFRLLLVIPAFYPAWVIPKHHEMAVHLLCCRHRENLLRRENRCTSLIGTAWVPHAHSIADSESSENPSSCSPWKLVMNLPLAGLGVLCYSAGVQVARRAGFAEGNWEVAKVALDVYFLCCRATRPSWLKRRCSLPSALMVPGLPQQHKDNVFSIDVLENWLQSPFEEDLCSFLCVLAAL